MFIFLPCGYFITPDAFALLTLSFGRTPYDSDHRLGLRTSYIVGMYHFFSPSEFYFVQVTFAILSHTSLRKRYTYFYVMLIRDNKQL